MTDQELFCDDKDEPDSAAGESGSDSLNEKETGGAKSKSGERKLDFEASLKRLENIVEEMENGNLSLDECLKHFEEGSKLANFCTHKLEETEKKVEILLKNDAGGGEWKQIEDKVEVEEE